MYTFNFQNGRDVEDCSDDDDKDDKVMTMTM
jgi:hypothetical protein